MSLVCHKKSCPWSIIGCLSRSRFGCRMTISRFLKTIYCARVIWICLFWHLLNVNSRHPAAISACMFTQRLWSIIRECHRQNCIPRPASQGNKFRTEPVPDYFWTSYNWHSWQPYQTSARLELPVELNLNYLTILFNY